jgi:hypothetical protein
MRKMFRPALSIICVAIACAILACPALAGNYVVHACSPGNSPSLWTQVNTGPGVFASGNLCGGPEIGPLDGSAGGSLFAEDILSSPAEVPDGARAGWTVTAPSGAMITAISYYRTLASHVDTDLAAGLFLPSGSPLEQCRIAMPFGSSIVCSKPNNQVPAVFVNLSTASLFFGVLCDIVTPGVVTCGAGGAPLHNAQAYMYSASVTISESAVPTVSNVDGALWRGRLVGGTVPVTFSASDGSGIREQAVQKSSGQTIASTVNGCDFSSQPPCPQSPVATLNVDTTRVPDGTQTFRLVVTDAAGNVQVVRSPPVTVDNQGPPPPVGLTATAQAGSNAVALAWTNPASPPAPVNGALAQLCSTSCTAPVSVNASGAARVDAPGPGTYTARVWLVDVAGRGGPHNAASAVVSVAPPPPPPPPPSSATRTRIGAQLHGRQLRVSGPIAGSGRVSVSWRSKVRGRTVGHGSRTVTIRDHRLRVTFAVPRRARVAAATIRAAVRRGQRVVGQARARRA